MSAPVHKLERLGYVTLCGKDSARTKWVKDNDAAVTCLKCRELAK